MVTKNNNQSNESTRNWEILIDTPINSSELDNIEKICLGFEKYSQSISEIILASKPHFAIGIFGGWGSGKTTLMNSIQKTISNTPSHCICVNFSAWRYEKEENLLIPLLETINEEINKWKLSKPGIENKKKVEKTVRKLSNIITSLVAGLSMEVGISKILTVSLDASKSLEMAKNIENSAKSKENQLFSIYYRCYKDLRETFLQFKADFNDTRIVIFVDDLDRCLPHNALNVLEAIKLFFDLDGFIFIVGVDKQILEWCIDNQYQRKESNNTFEKLVFQELKKEGTIQNTRKSSNYFNDKNQEFQIRGCDYLKKIFQIPIYLPMVSKFQLEEYLHVICSKLPFEQQFDIEDNVKEFLFYLIDEKGFNPREIKRFINAYTIAIKINPDFPKQILLSIKTIEFRQDWIEIYIALSTFGQLFVDSVRERNSKNLLIKNSFIPPSFDEFIKEGKAGSGLFYTDKKRPDYINYYFQNGLIGNESRFCKYLIKINGLYSQIQQNLQSLQARPIQDNLYDYKKMIDTTISIFTDIDQNVSNNSGSPMGTYIYVKEIEPMKQNLFSQMKNFENIADTFLSDPMDKKNPSELSNNTIEKWYILIEENVENMFIQLVALIKNEMFFEK